VAVLKSGQGPRPLPSSVKMCLLFPVPSHPKLVARLQQSLKIVCCEAVSWSAILAIAWFLVQITRHVLALIWYFSIVPYYIAYTYSVSQKKIPLRLSEFFHFFHKRLRIFNRFFLQHLLHVPMYTRLRIFMQLSPTLTKLCHIKRDYPVHVICTKCPKRAKTRAFRRLRKSLIALLIVVCGKSL